MRIYALVPLLVRQHVGWSNTRRIPRFDARLEPRARTDTNMQLHSEFCRMETLGWLLRQRGARRGVELGVQRGHFARALLSHWGEDRVDEYVLVDLWGQHAQASYIDDANVGVAAQEALMRETMGNLRGWNTRVCRDLTSECAKKEARLLYICIYGQERLTSTYTFGPCIHVQTRSNMSCSNMPCSNMHVRTCHATLKVPQNLK